MAEFLTTSGTSYHIENIILKAKKHLFLISPFLQISKTLKERLNDCGNRGVKITIIYGKNELKESEKEVLKNIKNISIYFFENLHAKAYLNENTLIVSSMNMYQFSEKNNREMSILIDKKNDNSVYNDAMNEVLSLINSAKKQDIKESKKGYCIRCRERIEFDLNRPFCNDCFWEWADYENYYYSEKFCHECGKKTKTSMLISNCKECNPKQEKTRKNVAVF